jgi:hypothetical protein
MSSTNVVLLQYKEKYNEKNSQGPLVDISNLHDNLQFYVSVTGQELLEKLKIPSSFVNSY